MNLAINNSTTQLAKANRPEFDNSYDLDDKPGLKADAVDLDSSRKIGEELGLAKPAKEIKSQNQEDKAVQALTGIANLGRKIGSKVLNILGFGGVTLSALSYILFRFKLLSAVIAAPALGAFYIANTLKKAAKESEEDSGVISDPRAIISKAKDDSTYLEKNFKKIVAAMVKVGEMKDKDPKKLEALKDLCKVAKKVAAKRTELKTVDKGSSQLYKIKQFMDIYDSVKIKDQSETDFEDQLHIES
jgi:polyhydroxyalkanoate synthesis regulator phasin